MAVVCAFIRSPWNGGSSARRCLACGSSDVPLRGPRRVPQVLGIPVGQKQRCGSTVAHELQGLVERRDDQLFQPAVLEAQLQYPDYRCVIVNDQNSFHS